MKNTHAGRLGQSRLSVCVRVKAYKVTQESRVWNNRKISCLPVFSYLFCSCSSSSSATAFQ